jgi:hypothetical protein
VRVRWAVPQGERVQRQTRRLQDAKPTAVCVGRPEQQAELLPELRAVQQVRRDESVWRPARLVPQALLPVQPPALLQEKVLWEQPVPPPELRPEAPLALP